MESRETQVCGGASGEELFEKICRGEGSTLSDRELLELALSFSGQRADAPLLARSLMERFSTLANVLDAEREAIECVEGVKPGTVRLLRLLKALIASERSERSGKKNVVLDTEDAAEYLRPYFHHARTERAYLLVLDGHKRVLNCIHLGDGTADSVNIEFSTILRNSLSRDSAGSILAHCHLSGSAQPSQQDLDITARLQELLSEVGQTLFDHLIFADDHYVSLARMGLMKTEERKDAKR